MAIGPVDVYIIGFPGNQFTGRIAPAVVDLIDQGIIRVIDMLLVIKDAEGNISSVEMADFADGNPSFMEISVVQPGALGPDDAEEVADDLPANSSALLLAFENVWAAKLAEEFRSAEAVVIDYIRIPADVVEAVITE